MDMKHEHLLFAGALVLLAPCLAAQQASAPAASAATKDSTPATTQATATTPATATTSATLSVNSRLVNLPVVVRDKKGALIQTLTKTDFTLEVDGKSQTIRYFDKDTDLPLVLGLLVDTSLSQRDVIDEEKTASSTFLDQMLTTPKDQAFIAQFAGQTELLQDLTTSRPLLQKALHEIDTPSNNSSPTSTDDSNSGSGSRHHSGGTTLYDALFLTSDEILSKQTGRKAIIILSDGVDRNSKETLVKSIEAAQRADTVIYAIYFKGEESHPMNNNQQHGRGGGFPGGGYPGGGYPGGGYPGGGYPGGGYPRGGNGGNYPTSESHTDGKKILQRMADETGGRLFEVKKKDVAQIYQEIAEELRAQYRLGYVPTQEASSDGYHQVDLSLHDKSLKVQTRDGYYAK